MIRAVAALLFGLAALPGARWLWSATYDTPYVRVELSNPLAAAALVLTAAAVGAWLRVPTQTGAGAVRGLVVALAALAVAVAVVLATRWAALGHPDDTEALVHVGLIALALTVVLSVLVGVLLAVVDRRLG